MKHPQSHRRREQCPLFEKSRSSTSRVNCFKLPFPCFSVNKNTLFICILLLADFNAKCAFRCSLFQLSAVIRIMTHSKTKSLQLSCNFYLTLKISINVLLPSRYILISYEIRKVCERDNWGVFRRIYAIKIG